MAIDPLHIGHRFPPFEAEVEAGRIRLFAKAIGATDQIHFDRTAARAAGYVDIVAPPTFLYCLGADAPDPFDDAHLVGFDLARTVHGEERIESVRPLCAGDGVIGRKRIVDLYERKGGALRFMITRTDYQDRTGAPVGMTTTTVVMRA